MYVDSPFEWLLAMKILRRTTTINVWLFAIATVQICGQTPLRSPLNVLFFVCSLGLCALVIKVPFSKELKCRTLFFFTMNLDWIYQGLQTTVIHADLRSCLSLYQTSLILSFPCLSSPFVSFSSVTLLYTPPFFYHFILFSHMWMLTSCLGNHGSHVKTFS